MRSTWVFRSLIIILIISTPSVILVQSLFVDFVDTKLEYTNIESENNLLNSISLSQSGYVIPKVSESNVIIDGIISPSEYEVSYNEALSNISFYWENDGENLTIGIVVPSLGWVSWGAGQNMNNATFIMGGVSDSSLYCIDMNGIGYTLPENDTDNGGTDDIKDCASTEGAQTTTLEFIFPLDTGDILDPVLELDSVVEMFFAFSVSGSDNLSSHHGTTSGRTEILSVLIDSVESISKPEIGDFDKSIPLVKDSSVIIDGEIGIFEYGRSFTNEKSGVEVFWEHNEIDFTVGLISPGTGWVSLGIGSDMADSTMYMGGFEDGQTYCVDLNGLADWGHEEDELKDGNNDIIECIASENADRTMLEFRIPLNSSDDLDRDLEPLGIYDMFLGYQASDDNRSQIHTGRSDAFKVLVMPEADSYDTILDFTSETEADFNQTLFFEVTLTNENDTELANMPVIFYRKTQFGIVIFESTITDADGKANASYCNPFLLYNHTFGVKALEFVNVTDAGDLYTYLSSENEQVINFKERIEHDDRAENLRLSRIGLIAAFWIVGIIIWGGFGYVYYQVFQIFKARNEEISSNDKNEGISNDKGGSQ